MTTKNPVIYLEWVNCLDELEEGKRDNEVFIQLINGTFPKTPEVAERILARVFQIIMKRIEEAIGQFQDTIKRGYDEAEWAKGIQLLRRRLTKIWQIGQISSFPKEFRELMDQKLEEYIANFQRELVDSFQSDRTGRLSSFFRNNPIILEKKPFKVDS